MSEPGPSIYFSQEHDLLRAQIRRFVDSEVRPHGESWEAAGKVPRDVFRAMGAIGLLGIRFPEAYGGSQMDALGTIVLAEELGRSTFGGFAASILVHTDMAAPHLARAGSERQKTKYLPAIIAGEKITAIAVTEPGAGSDVSAIATTARLVDGQWVLNGSKIFITNGVFADLVFVAAKTDNTVKGAHGTSIFIVERGTPGFDVGRQLEKTGWRCSDTAELHFNDCRVPEESLLGEVNRGFYAIMNNFQNERLSIGAMAIGEAQQAIDLTLEHTQQRQAFGAPLWQNQVIRQKLAELQARVDAARQLVYHTAWLDSERHDCVREVSEIKALCGSLVNEVTFACVQFHGGMGYMHGVAIERMARDARVQTIGGGATEIMLEEVAKRMG